MPDSTSPPAPASATSAARQPAALCAAVLVLFSLLFALTFHAMVDDAYISFRYADHWADGRGLVFNPNGPPVEGYSNFLWVAALALQRVTIGWTTPSTALLLAYLAGAGTILLTYRAGPLLGLTGAVTRNLPGLFLALNPAFVGLGHMGLETLSFAFFVTGALLRWCHERATPGARPVAWMWLLAVALSRPEGVALACYVVAYEALRPRVAGNRRRWWVLGAIGFTVPFVAYHLLRYRYFGQWLPNPFYAKVPLGRWATVERGLRYTAGFLLTHDGMYHTVSPLRVGFKWLLLLPAGVALWKRPSATTLPLAGAALCYTAFIIVVGGDWMPFHRFYGHVLPLFVILAAQGFQGAPPATRRHRVAWRAAVACVVAGQFGEGLARDMPALTNWRADLPALARAPLTRTREAVHRLRTQPTFGQVYARWFTETYPPGTVATGDAVGVVPYYTPLSFIDTLGLVDTEVAQYIHAGDHEGAARAVLAREPDLICNDIFATGGLAQSLGITTVDRHILGSETYATRYRLTRVIEVRSTGSITVLYLTVSERRAETLAAPGATFRDQFAAFLADPGAERWNPDGTPRPRQ